MSNGSCTNSSNPVCRWSPDSSPRCHVFRKMSGNPPLALCTHQTPYTCRRDNPRYDIRCLMHLNRAQSIAAPPSRSTPDIAILCPVDTQISNVTFAATCRPQSRCTAAFADDSTRLVLRITISPVAPLAFQTSSPSFSLFSNIHPSSRLPVSPSHHSLLYHAA